MPTRFRDVIRNGGGDGLMITRMDRALFAYTFDEWSKKESRILALAETSEAMRRFRRIFIGGAAECNCDRQGRILIPPTLRQYAGLEKEIAIVGSISHFEIWAMEKYEAEAIKLEEDMQREDVGNEIAKLAL